MRVDLKVPFAEKDAAKAAGARWDVNLKVWYVDAADLTRFARWIPAAAFQAKQNRPSLPQQVVASKAAPTPQKASSPAPLTVLPGCGCDMPPWEDCEHTAGR